MPYGWPGWALTSRLPKKGIPDADRPENHALFVVRQPGRTMLQMKKIDIRQAYDGTA
jgi:hypothetical protein